MASSTGHYDTNLLGATEAPTRGQLQEGYDPKLYNQPPLTPNKRQPNPSSSAVDLTAKPERAHAIPATTRSGSVPFYRTRKGQIILGVVALLAIGAIVGGAVGGTQGKNKNKNDNKGGLGAGEQQTTSATSGSSGLADPGTAAAGVGSQADSTTTQATTTSAGNPTDVAAGIGSIVGATSTTPGQPAPTPQNGQTNNNGQGNTQNGQNTNSGQNTDTQADGQVDNTNPLAAIGDNLAIGDIGDIADLSVIAGRIWVPKRDLQRPRST